MPSTSDGPYLALAILCEKVLQEKDNVLSAIRIIDKVTYSLTGSHPQEVSSPAIFNLFALISFKSGRSGGKYNIRLVPKAPSGEKVGEFTAPILLEGNGLGANIIINLNLQAKEAGLYWFDVMLNDQLATRIPLHVEYHEMQTETDTTSH